MSSSSVVVPVVLTVMLLGAGCANPIESAKEKMTESVVSSITGGKVKMDASEGGAMFTDPETGSRMALGEDVKIPDTFPKDVPIYAGAKAKAIVMAANGDKNATVSLTSSDVPKTVSDWYAKQLTDAGWTQSSTYSANGSFLHVFEKGAAKIAITVASDAGTSGSSVTVVRTEEEKK